ncbi:MAG: GNAT family N-acetyltransferase [Halofilum sp. (in: g-proteobacteria)]|nr:GNAT family N-acetyltransferase [Halofilum sp. (in: g-proteobacteria)]
MDATPTLQAQLDPDEELLRAVAEAEPENPFHTPAFARARMRRGERAAAFLAAAAGESRGCTGFVAQGRIHRDLNIVSAPAIDADHPLWGAIEDFCGREGITRLRVQTFGSMARGIPSLGNELFRAPRREFVLALGPECPPLTLSSNHRRNVRRAERAGIEVHERDDPEAGETHATLIGASMSRRRHRGEGVSSETAADPFHHFLATGAGTVFQARDAQGTVLSSMLVLQSARGAYYHSAGTSPEGMKSGASQLLVATVAERLRDRGITRFNLGGAGEEQTGLARFKSGFRPETVELEAATFDVARGARRTLIGIAEGLRSQAARLRGMRSTGR